MRAAAIFGPAASKKDLAAFHAAGVEFGDAETIAGSDAALIFGGDGTVHRFLAELLEHKVPLLAVPTGSGNDFYREIGTGTRALATEAWRGFLAGKPPRAIDLGVITDAQGARIVYCCVAGLGLDSDANLRANAMPSWLKRHGGYVVAGLQSVFAYKPQRVRVTALGPTGDDNTIDARATMVAIGNAPAYGDGLHITPRAVFDDGKLDVCFVRALSKSRILRVFPRIFRGTHLELKEVEYFQTGQLRIETETPMRIHADGEHACYTPVEISVLPKALQVILP
ncbi:MAG: diacylglycerol kinase family lipid kinase [Acidobacteriota bacterium]|nr:diacylglycerol kinase family lipid kinase [Acidobacteriota bacterium]